MNFDNAINKDKLINNALMHWNTKNPNYIVLESTKNASDNWRQYIKVGGVWGSKLEAKTYVKSLENKTGDIVGKKGEYILMGEEKERWFMKAEDFKKKYKLREGKNQNIDQDNKIYDWYDAVEVKPIAAIRMHKPFQVIHERSTEPLYGKPGDYIAMYAEDLGNPDPKDVWIISEKVFNKTYKKVL